jgi:histidinol-phosphate aminotransferase
MESSRLSRRVPLIGVGRAAPASASAPAGAAPELPQAGGPEPVASLQGLKGFQPPPRSPEIDLFLDSNEGPPVPPQLLDVLRAAIAPTIESAEAPGGSEAELLRRYPTAARVQALWAAKLGIAADRVLVTAGGDEATDRICRAFLGPGRELVLPVPTFEMLGHYPRLAAASTREIPWPPGTPYPLQAVLSAVTQRTSVIALVSPNNPTGAAATTEDLVQLSKAAPRALLLIDQAYTEFADVDLTPVALELPSAVVIRTLSKARGLAGIRVGCAAGPAWIIDRLRATGGPFTVPALSLLMAGAALERPRLSEHYIAHVRIERGLLVELLRECGVESWPSQGNFVLARFAGAAEAERVRASLADEGIAVRIMAPRWQAWDLTGCLRITCPGDMLLFERLAAALLRALAEP